MTCDNDIRSRLLVQAHLRETCSEPVLPEGLWPYLERLQSHSMRRTTRDGSEPLTCLNFIEAGQRILENRVLSLQGSYDVTLLLQSIMEVVESLLRRCHGPRNGSRCAHTLWWGWRLWRRSRMLGSGLGDDIGVWDFSLG
jgi:hypothetical protein